MQKLHLQSLHCLWRQVSFVPSFIAGSSGLLCEHAVVNLGFGFFKKKIGKYRVLVL